MEIEINRDLRKYKSKDVGNFTFWQFGWGALGLIAIAVGIFIAKSLNPDWGLKNVGITTILPGVPFIIIGFFEIQRMNVIEYIKNIFPEKFLMKKQLVWKSEFKYEEDTGKKLFGEDCELIPIIKDDENSNKKVTKSKKQ